MLKAGWDEESSDQDDDAANVSVPAKRSRPESEQSEE